MTTEVWWRSPEYYVRKLVDVGATNIVWHNGILVKRRIDPVVHARMFFPTAEWRVMNIGIDGALEWNWQSRDVKDPVACYPTWHYGEPWERLVDLCESDVPGQPWNQPNPLYRPREGQERRIVIINWPNTSQGGMRFMTKLADLQVDYPETIIHIFEARFFPVAFGLGYRAADLEPMTEARFKRVLLPNGLRIHVDQLKREHYQWIHLLGFGVADLQENQQRIRFNIASAIWAGENYLETRNFRVQGRSKDVISTQDVPVKVSKGKSLVHSVGDKVSCDHCSLFNRCKLARAGAVCIVSDAETNPLATYFKTRDSARIVEGLSELLARNAERVERGMKWERDSGELDPELTKILTSMMEGGVKLAKLVDPQLAALGGPKLAIQINQGSGTTQVTAANPASLMAAIVKELEAGGIPRDQITPEMIFNAVGGGHQPDAIEVASEARP